MLMYAHRTHLLAGTAVLVGMALTACGVSPTPTATPVTSVPPTDTPSTSVIVESEPPQITETPTSPTPTETPASTDPVYANSQSLGLVPAWGTDSFRMAWRGGMIGGGGTINTGSAQVWGWLPGMTEVKVCDLPLWQANEYPPSDIVAGQGISFAATIGPNPVAAVVYTATTEASGLTPESTHVWLQSVDFVTCALGTRVDVLGGPVPDDMYAPSPRIIGWSDDVLAIVPFPTIVPSLGDAPALVGINPTTSTVIWQHSFPGQTLNIEKAQQADGTIGVGWGKSGSSWDDRLISVADGTTLLKTSKFFTAPAARLSADRFVYTPYLQTVNTQVAHTATGDVPVTGGAMSETALMGSDGQGNAILVGFFCAKGASCPSINDSERGIGYIGQNNAITPVLTKGQVSGLSLKLLGVSDGKLYVSTSSEHLVVGLDGQQIGEAYDSKTYPYVPVGERYFNGTLYTLWWDDPGPMSAQFVGPDGYVITQNGEQPIAFSQR